MLSPPERKMNPPLKKMNPPYVFMNPPPNIMNPSKNVRRSHIFSVGFIFYDAGFIYATWRTRLKK